jgi:hypothetical protein
MQKKDLTFNALFHGRLLTTTQNANHCRLASKSNVM